MSFLAPMFLWAIPLIAAPVIIHLYHRRHRNVIQWGAMEFLMASITPQRRMLRWKELVLLLLRVTAILAIIGALAQPLVSRLGGGGAPRDIILILDNSLSTTRKHGTGSAFDELRSSLEAFVESLKPHDSVRALVTSPAPRWIQAEAIAANASGKRDLLERFAAVEPSDGAADLAESTMVALRIAGTREDAQRTIVLVSDGQAFAWRTNALYRWAAVKAASDRMTQAPRIEAIIPEIALPKANLAVTGIRARREVVSIGQTALLESVVKNFGPGVSEAASVAWRVGKRSLGTHSVPSLQSGESVTLSLSESFPTAGLREITCEVTATDDLPRDNGASYLLNVRDRAAVLVVSGEPNSDLTLSDTEYFVAALGSSMFEPTVIDHRALEREDLGSFLSVVLANVPALPEGQLNRLKAYVRSGGGLWVALGDQTDAPWFNTALFSDGLGLAPMAIKGAVGEAHDRDKAIPLRRPEANHPATVLLAEAALSDIDRARVSRRFQFENRNSAATTVLLRAEGGDSFATESSFGRGRVIVQAAPLGIAWSNLPLNQSYVVMVHEWLWRLTEPALGVRNVRAGESLRFTANSAAWRGTASWRLPSGESAVALAGRDESMLVFQQLTHGPGEYTLTLLDRGGGEQEERFMASRTADESDLAPLTEDGMAQIATVSGIDFGPSHPSAKATQPAPSPREPIALSLLYFLAALLAAESIIAYWIFASRRAGVRAARLSP